MELLELKGSGASKLLSNLVQADIIEPVSGHGKGKYKFNKYGDIELREKLKSFSAYPSADLPETRLTH